MKVLDARPAARSDRYATALLHDDARARVVAFHLEPGQVVPPHHSEALVLVMVTAGSGRFSGADSEAVLSVGDAAVFEPGEVHGIIAGEEAVQFLVVIAPRPGG